MAWTKKTMTKNAVAKKQAKCKTKIDDTDSDESFPSPKKGLSPSKCTNFDNHSKRKCYRQFAHFSNKHTYPHAYHHMLWAESKRSKPNGPNDLVESMPNLAPASISKVDPQQPVGTFEGPITFHLHTFHLHSVLYCDTFKSLPV